MNNIGYCCINLSLNKGKSPKEKISTNRGMKVSTFKKKGLSYVSELAIKNLIDLKKILEWNISNDIYVYRMSSEVFPCIGFYQLRKLPNFDKIENHLKDIGNYAKLNKMRLSFHPSHYCIIASQNMEVVKTSIDELNKHAEIMDLMKLNQSHYYPINVHIGTTKPTIEEAAKRFIKWFNMLSESCQKRLTLENDDSVNQFSVKMLYDLVYTKIGVPIVFDQHHWNYGPKDQTMEEALKLACSTWDTKPMTHMSSSRVLEDSSVRKTSHADYIYEKIETFGLDFDTEIEAKAKDLAVLKYRKEFNILKS